MVLCLATSLTQKRWPLERLIGSAFGGDVGEVPPIPKDMLEIMQAACPYNSQQYTGASHMLFLMPKTVNQQPFNWQLFTNLLAANQGKDGVELNYYPQCVVDALEGAEPIEHSYWILMTTNVIPQSQNKTYTEQTRLVQEKGGADNYQAPRALEAVVGPITHRVKTGPCSYGIQPVTYTNCQEMIRDPSSFTKQSHVAVELTSQELDVDSFPFVSNIIGMAAARRFPGDA